jgi:hypothetical protein
MALPPLWKVRRELNRIRVKTTLFVSRWLYDPVRRLFYDLTSRWRLSMTAGALPLTDRVAVFVIYQPGGLPASIYLTLDHLRQNRFSALVVSNGPLRDEDRATLARNAAIVMERPNVGYDFGAYRDGIRHLWSLKHDLSRLVLMNDSTWFPLRRDDDSLARMEALEADLAGHILKRASKKFDHVESHLLMFSERALSNPAIRSFWSNYVMSNSRDSTIIIGEVAITQLALTIGFLVQGLLGREQILTLLSILSEDELLDCLTHLSLTTRESKYQQERLLSAARSGLEWREAFIAWASEELMTSREHFVSTSFIDVAVRLGKMGFLKKSRDPRFHFARCALIRSVENGRIDPIESVIFEEVKSAVRSWIPPQDWIESFDSHRPLGKVEAG